LTIYASPLKNCQEAQTSSSKGKKTVGKINDKVNLLKFKYFMLENVFKTPIALRGEPGCHRPPPLMQTYFPNYVFSTHSFYHSLQND